ncbi:MAG: hypothetical protein JW829_16215 [Pirellulales bacterium]|nr:hypothetical protein [Pirellulales bacterium]
MPNRIHSGGIRKDEKEANIALAQIVAKEIRGTGQTAVVCPAIAERLEEQRQLRLAQSAQEKIMAGKGQGTSKAVLWRDAGPVEALGFPRCMTGRQGGVDSNFKDFPLRFQGP